MKKRVKKSIFLILSVVLFAMFSAFFLWFTLFKNFANETVRVGGYAIFLAYLLFTCIYSLLYFIEVVEFDENGIYAYRVFGKQVFISWDSITNVYLKLHTQRGKIAFVTNNEYHYLKLEGGSSFKPNGCEAVVVPYTLGFLEALTFHRPDIVPIRLD